jgi:hypothetical protein
MGKMFAIRWQRGISRGESNQTLAIASEKIAPKHGKQRDFPK